MRRSRRAVASATSSARCCPTSSSAACARRSRTACRPRARPACGTSTCAARAQGRGHRQLRLHMTVTSNGGTGARPMKDGLSATAYPSGVKGTPVEIAELVTPLIFWRKELRPDSGGAGRTRGGLGQIIEIESGIGRPFDLLAAFDRIDHPPRGRDGGRDGAAGYVGLKSGRKLKGKGFQEIPTGDRLVVMTPGAPASARRASASGGSSRAIWKKGWFRRRTAPRTAPLTKRRCSYKLLDADRLGRTEAARQPGEARLRFRGFRDRLQLRSVPGLSGASEPYGADALSAGRHPLRRTRRGGDRIAAWFRGSLNREPSDRER